MNTVILKIKGKNIDNFIKRLNRNKIEIFKIQYIKYNELNIEVLYKDYEKINKIKTVYEVEVIKYKGIKNIKNKIIYNKYLLGSFLIGIILFTILSNLVFEIQIDTNSSKIRNIVFSELNNHGIKKYHFAKSFREISKIKQEILNNNKDILEWMEIQRIGVKYLIKLEPRKINNIIEDKKIYNIVSNNYAIIKSIEAYSGEVIRNINDYVEPGEIIINSNITLNDEVKDTLSAKGKVYGEVWYKITIDYPLTYYEEKETGKYKNVYNLKIINKDFNFSKMKNYKKYDKDILSLDLLPIKITKQLQKEIEVINYNLTKEEALNKALEKGRCKINELLSGKEHIIDEKSLKIEMNDSKIVVDIFYTVYKDITEYKEIEG